MPFLGMDAVFQCDAQGCDAVARVRLPAGQSEPPSMMAVVAKLEEEGFQVDEGGWVCWHHGGGKRRGPEPAPSLQGEKT